jgi:hypothetical protein
VREGDCEKVLTVRERWRNANGRSNEEVQDNGREEGKGIAAQHYIDTV